MKFPLLNSAISIGGCEVKNRIVFTGHDTVLPKQGQVSDELVAYLRARAAGGCGLIVTQVAGIHHTARYTNNLLMAVDDDFITGYRRIVESCHAHGTKVFGQLFHPGRELSEDMDGTPALAYAPSMVPSERFRTIPRKMSIELIAEIIDGYAQGARRMQAAGGDGAEIVASQGYLPAQFLGSLTNTRSDQYGGSAENRLRFILEVIAAIRAQVGSEFVLGIRMSVDEMDHAGVSVEEALGAIEALNPHLDFLSLVAGSSSTRQGATHIVPSMEHKAGYTAALCKSAKNLFNGPVIVTGRINQPQIAEEILSAGDADLCGMTRAMICDPEMANKTRAGDADEIRACIGCNQSCIGHFQKGVPISCIQHPETGRELRYGELEAVKKPKRILVVGGGPAGLKAAAIAATRGHEVKLMEASARLGGQALLAQLLPQRAEFGGIVTNLSREAERAGVTVCLNQKVDSAVVKAEAADEVILACGATPYWPPLEISEDTHVVDAWQVINGSAEIGNSVLIADWSSDWISLGLAEKLARDGCRVRLATTGASVGQSIPEYIKDRWANVLLNLGVEILPYLRLFGADQNTVYMERTVLQEPVIFEDVDTLVLTQGHKPESQLAGALDDLNIRIHLIGDCLTPRNAEAAVLDGLKIGAEL